MGRHGKTRNRAERLRRAVEALPARTKEAMLRGLDSNRIIVGAYVDPRTGGICPMLAAHRNGGRTSLASFARSWDCYTGAKRPRLATRRELRTLRSLLEASLAHDEIGDVTSLGELASRIRTERAEFARRETPSPTPDAGEHHRARELRGRPRRAWLRPARRYDVFRDLLAAAEEQLSERRAAELLGDRPAERLR